MYRDELTQAKKRLEELDEQLAEQKKELTVLRAQLGKRLREDGAPPRSRAPIVVGVLVLLMAVGGVIASVGDREDPADSSAHDESRAAASVITEVSPPPGPRARPTSRDYKGPDEARAQQLATRCERRIPRASLDGLPAGTEVLDFVKCVGCPCCLQGGEFPRMFDERQKVNPERGPCDTCSRAATLEAAGLTVSGGRPDNPLRGSSDLVFHLAKPSRVFALRLGGGGYQITPEPQPDHVIALVAYDPKGRPIDAARAIYPSSKETSESAHDFRDLKKILLVQPCDGETIGRVDLLSSDINVHIDAIANFPID